MNPFQDETNANEVRGPSGHHSRDTVDLDFSSLVVSSPFRTQFLDHSLRQQNQRPDTLSSIYSQHSPTTLQNIYTQKPLPTLPLQALNTSWRVPTTNRSRRQADSYQSPRHVRSSSRSTSPIKPLSDLRENEVVSFPYSPVRAPSPFRDFNIHDLSRDSEDLNRDGVHLDPLPPTTSTSPIKRSRSPSKDLFGVNGILGRSASLKELPSDLTRKFGFKALGDKLKQRTGGIVSESGCQAKHIIDNNHRVTVWLKNLRTRGLTLVYRKKCQRLEVPLQISLSRSIRVLSLSY